MNETVKNENSVILFYSSKHLTILFYDYNKTIQLHFKEPVHLYQIACVYNTLYNCGIDSTSYFYPPHNKT